MKRKTSAGRAGKPKANIYYLALAVAALGALLVFGWWVRVPDKGPQLRAYFFKDEKLAAVERQPNPDLPPLKQAITELLAGPSERERGAGFTTMIPAGVRILRVKTDGAVAIVDLSRELEEYGGGSAKVEGMIAQLVYTATGVPGIDKAWIWVEGQRSVVLGGEGLVLDRPLGRQDVKD